MKTTVAAMAGVAVAPRPLWASGNSGRERPNILFIFTDQQNAEMVSATGNRWCRTPALDALARDGIRFERAYCANPLCVPSRISMATGLMPGRFGVYENREAKTAVLPAAVNAHSLGKLLKRAGYATFYGGKVHLPAALHPLQAGYDVYEKDQRGGLPARCLEFVTQRRDAPFFAVASFVNPHDICYAHGCRDGNDPKQAPGLLALYRQAAALPDDQLPPLPENFAVPAGEPAAVAASTDPDAPTPPGVMRETYSERDWRLYRWVYARLTERVDAEIGELLAGLRRAGLEDNTLIVFTSDHGNLAGHHRLASKKFFYEESARVPLLMKFGGAIPAGQVDTMHLISTGLDLLPTFCDYAGIEPPPGLLGRSLRGLAEGRQVTGWRRFVAVESRTWRMVRSARYKYAVYDRGENSEWLGDLEDDPGELRNRAAEAGAAATLQEHRAWLKAWCHLSGDRDGPCRWG